MNDAKRKNTSSTGYPVLCDNAQAITSDWWYRFQGNAGSKMATDCVKYKRCGGNFPGWLIGDHPSVADGEVEGRVCFRNTADCRCQFTQAIKVKNCSLYYVYQLHHVSKCDSRYCGAD